MIIANIMTRSHTLWPCRPCTFAVHTGWNTRQERRQTRMRQIARRRAKAQNTSLDLTALCCIIQCWRRAALWSKWSTFKASGQCPVEGIICQVSLNNNTSVDHRWPITWRLLWWRHKRCSHCLKSLLSSYNLLPAARSTYKLPLSMQYAGIAINCNC